MTTLTVGSNVNVVEKRLRDSNLELYRIVLMLLIVAHHYVVNSQLHFVVRDAAPSLSTISMLLFGAWGKTGINCFVMITGYFMCRSSISLRKFLKLYLQITFYTVLLYIVFCFSGHQTFSPVGFARTFFPVWDIKDGFVECFLIFYLLIPFLNIFINAMDRRQHRMLALLLIGVYSVMPMIGVHVKFNYVTWFVVLYIAASYIRLYNWGEGISHRRWGWITISLIIIASISIIAMYFLYKKGYVAKYTPYIFVADSNKLLALALAVASFMWFKSLRISNSAIINAVGASTFGVLLIHANSDAMRQWLWNETVDTVGHFSGEAAVPTVIYAIAAVIAVFALCSLIDYCRARLIEPYILNPVHSLLCRWPLRSRGFSESD